MADNLISLLQVCIGWSDIYFHTRSVKVPSAFISYAAGETKLSAGCLMHPKRPYSAIHCVLSIQFAS